MKKSEESKTDYSNGLEFPDPAEQTDYSNNVVFDAPDDESSPFIPSDKIALKGYRPERSSTYSQSILSLSGEETVLLEDIIAREATGLPAQKRRPAGIMTASREQEAHKSTEEDSFSDIKKAIDDLMIQSLKKEDSIEDILNHVAEGEDGTLSEQLDRLRQLMRDKELEKSAELLSHQTRAKDQTRDSIPALSDEDNSPIASFSDEDPMPVRTNPKRREAQQKSHSDFIPRDANSTLQPIREVKSDEKHHHSLSNLFGHISPHLARKTRKSDEKNPLDTSLSSSPPKAGQTNSRPTSPTQPRKTSKPEDLEVSSPKFSKRKGSKPDTLDKEALKEKRRKGSQPESPEVSSSPPKGGHTNSRPTSPTPSPKEGRRKISDPITPEEQHSPTAARKFRRAASKMRLLGESISGSPENLSDSSDDLEQAIESIQQYQRKISSYQLTLDPLGNHIKDGDIDAVLKFRLENDAKSKTVTLIHKAIASEQDMEPIMVRRLLHCYGDRFEQGQIYTMLNNTNADKEHNKVYELLQHGALGIPILIGASVIKYGDRRKLHHRPRHEIHKDDLANDHHTIAAQYIAAFNLMCNSSISEIALRIQNHDFKLPGQKKDIVHGEANQEAVIDVMRQQFSETNGILYLIANHIATLKNKKTWDIISKLCSTNLIGIIEATTSEYSRVKFTEASGKFASSKMRHDGMEKMFDQIDRAREDFSIQ